MTGSHQGPSQAQEAQNCYLVAAVAAAVGSRNRVVVAVVAPAVSVILRGIRRLPAYWGIPVGDMEKGQRVVAAAAAVEMTEMSFGHPLEAEVVAVAGNSLTVASEGIPHPLLFEAKAEFVVVVVVVVAAAAAAIVEFAAAVKFAVVELPARVVNAVAAAVAS